MGEMPAQMKPSKAQKPIIARKPNAIIYAIANALVSLFLRVAFHLKVDLSAIRGLEPPYLLLCNHSCNLDFLISAVAMYPQKLNFMSAALYFQNPLLAWLLTLMGCFPKRQFVSDVQSVRNILRLLKSGAVPVLYPSGQSSFTGMDTLIDPSISKLLRVAGAPVAVLYTDGAHTGFPKWNMKRLRPTRITSKAFQLFTAEELDTLDDQTIYRRVVEALAFDDCAWQKKNKIAAKKPRCAEGLEQLLFLCPACEKEFTIQAHGSRLSCAHCGYEAKMDEYGTLHTAAKKGFDTATAWYRFEREYYRGKLSPDFCYKEPVKLFKITKQGKLVPAGEGEALINMAAFEIKGAMDGEKIHFVIDNSLSGVFPHEKRTCFEVMAEGQLYAVAPENPRAVFKFILLKEEIFRALRPEAI